MSGEEKQAIKESESMLARSGRMIKRQCKMKPRKTAAATQDENDHIQAMLHTMTQGMIKEITAIIEGKSKAMETRKRPYT